ncbi:helix-turn-helix domain-containing protein [Silvibacterium acidisoli]|uniref:helix-turn-helix domain-containing protein n=1 Tax=Acidobacteriaceae bacterium ZG23-2 TaxID=2883246 RepID=UPI00406BE53C
MSRKSQETAPDAVVKKRLLNVNEAAQYLGSTVNTLHKKRSLREIPFVKIGRSLRFDIKALDLFIEQNTVETLD